METLQTPREQVEHLHCKKAPHYEESLTGFSERHINYAYAACLSHKFLAIFEATLSYFI